MTRTRSIHTVVRSYLTVLDELGGTLDKPFRKEIDQHLNLIAKLDSTDLSGPTIGEATYDALAEGLDPISAPTVHDAIVRAKLRSMESLGMLAQPGRDRLLATIQNRTDELVAGLVLAYNNAGEQFHQAHKELTAEGINGVNDPKITTKTITTARSAFTAREALDVMNRIGQTTAGILLATDQLVTDPIGRVVRIIEPGTATTAAIKQLSTNHWKIVGAGYTISLATPTETQARIDRARDADRKFAAEQDKAIKQKMRTR